MDMETVLPRTCKSCNGTGYMYYSSDTEYDVKQCECQSEEVNA